VGQPAPFTKLPLVWERALGGANADNPVGVGLDLASAPPNLIHAQPGRSTEAAGFAPVPATWPARAALLRGLARERLDAPIAAPPDHLRGLVPDGPPADQRIRPLRGREWIVLEGLPPAHPRLHMRLPAVRAAARVVSPASAPQILPLEPDTLFLDGDAERASI